MICEQKNTLLFSYFIIIRCDARESHVALKREGFHYYYYYYDYLCEVLLKRDKKTFSSYFRILTYKVDKKIADI